MTDTAPSGTPSAPRRKRPPTWGIVAFLVVLAGLAVLNQSLSTGGPEIQWFDGSYEAALALAGERNQRLFLYLYEANDPVHARNEREVFTQRWAREPLARTVCCRIAVRKGDILAAKFDYRDTPLFLLISPRGGPPSRTEGAVDERQFRTYIGEPAQRPL